MAEIVAADDIREAFSQAMSAMYQQEVPQYGTLLELVADVNLAVLEHHPKLHEQLANADELARLNVERHGAIRVGKASELATLRRMFAVMGMHPVSYYDLSQAGVPVQPPFLISAIFLRRAASRCSIFMPDRAGLPRPKPVNLCARRWKHSAGTVMRRSITRPILRCTMSTG